MQEEMWIDAKWQDISTWQLLKHLHDWKCKLANANTFTITTAPRVIALWGHWLESGSHDRAFSLRTKQEMKCARAESPSVIHGAHTLEPLLLFCNSPPFSSMVTGQWSERAITTDCKRCGSCTALTCSVLTPVAVPLGTRCRCCPGTECKRHTAVSWPSSASVWFELMSSMIDSAYRPCCRM